MFIRLSEFSSVLCYFVIFECIRVAVASRSEEVFIEF
jgi:hypothetical protein